MYKLALLSVALSMANAFSMTLNELAKLVQDSNPDEKMGLTQLITSAMSKTDPKEIIVPGVNSTGTKIDNFPFQIGGENGIHTITGEYQNTTRQSKEQSYTYMWRKACAFSKWVPTNQYLHAHEADALANKIDWKSMDLSRFGFIGSEKICYWGLIAVLWVTPLPVSQELAALRDVHGGLQGTYTGH